MIEAIKEGLRYKDMTQKELASRIGVPECTLSRWLRGNRKIPANKFILICSVLDISIIVSTDGTMDIKIGG